MNIAQARELVNLLHQWREAAAPVCSGDSTAGWLSTSNLKALRLVAASHDGAMSRLEDAICPHHARSEAQV